VTVGRLCSLRLKGVCAMGCGHCDCESAVCAAPQGCVRDGVWPL